MKWKEVLQYCIAVFRRFRRRRKKKRTNKPSPIERMKEAQLGPGWPGWFWNDGIFRSRFRVNCERSWYSPCLKTKRTCELCLPEFKIFKARTLSKQLGCSWVFPGSESWIWTRTPTFQKKSSSRRAKVKHFWDQYVTTWIGVWIGRVSVYFFTELKDKHMWYQWYLFLFYNYPQFILYFLFLNLPRPGRPWLRWVWKEKRWRICSGGRG